MEQKIKSISEAFSMQPRCEDVYECKKYGEPKDKFTFLKEIKLEQVPLPHQEEGQGEWFYVGYNFQGGKIFQYLMMSVNVRYCYE